MIYLEIPLEQWKNNMVCHLRDERKRNDLLQRKLDEANAQIARMQAAGMGEAAKRYAASQERIAELEAQVLALKENARDGAASAIGRLSDMDLESIKIAAMQEALDRSKTVQDAAKMLGINRTTLFKCIREHGLRQPEVVCNLMAHRERVMGMVG